MNGANSGNSIPSLKRTLSNSASGSSSAYPSSSGNPNTGRLGVGMNSIPSVLHTSLPHTSPPQMARAATASGVYHRSNTGGRNVPHSSAISASAVGPPGGATRSVSQSTNSGSSTSMQDWRTYLTIEERQAVRAKIRDAYTSRCQTYEDLLQVACAIEEELLHISAPSRLDYFKSGFEFENRVKLKKDQLQGQLNALEKRRASSAASGVSKSPASTSSPQESRDESALKKQRS